MRRTALAAFLTIVVAPHPVWAQVSVRQSFAAAGQESKPATFMWTIQEEPDDVSFGTIDAAIRYALEKGGLVAGPIVEWHKLIHEERGHDRYLLGGSGELILSAVGLPWLGSPYFTGQAAYERNRLEGDSGLAFSVSGTFFSTAPWAPGGQHRLWPRSMLRYYPHLGLERHPAVADSIGDVSTALFKLNVEFWPWVGRIQTLASRTVRSEVGGSALPSDMRLLSLALNVYLDSSQRIGFGVEHTNGAQPRDGFAEVHRTTIGFKAKLP